MSSVYELAAAQLARQPAACRGRGGDAVIEPRWYNPFVPCGATYVMTPSWVLRCRMATGHLEMRLRHVAGLWEWEEGGRVRRIRL